MPSMATFGGTERERLQHAMTLIRELIDIPTQVRDGDFVLKLTEGVGDDAAAATVASYEVTPQLAHAFDAALGKIAGAVSSGSSEALYLHGSFGSGKSHFMAVLHLLLKGPSGRPGQARAAPGHRQARGRTRWQAIPAGARPLPRRPLDGAEDPRRLRGTGLD